MTARLRAGLACALAVTLHGPALALDPGGANEATLTPPGERLAVTPTQVDMRSGRYAYGATDLSIGDSAAGGLALERGMEASLPGHISPFGNFGHNWEIMLSEKFVDIDESDFSSGTGPDHRMFVHFAGRSETFDAKQEDSGYQQSSNNWRATLTSSGGVGSGTATHTYTAADGTVAVFRPLGGAPGGDCSTLRRCAYVSYVVHPDGSRLDFEYDNGPPARLRAVVSNRGFALLLQYGSGSDANHVVSACVLNLAVQPKPANNVCPQSSQASTSYGYTSFEGQRRLASATDAAGQAAGFTYERVGGQLRMGFLRPGDSAAWLVNRLTERANNEGPVDELVDRQDFVDGTSWTFSRTFAPQVDGEIAQVAGGSFMGPAGYTVEVGFGFERRPAVAGPSPVNVGDILWQITPSPGEVVDPLGRATTSDYCDRFVAAALPSNQPHRCLVTLLQSFTEADGRVTELTYDGHTTRNITEVRRKAQPGSLQPNGQPWLDIVTRATYSCTNNIVCNRPTSRTDANGNTTDYVWDSVHGGLLSETGPAVGGVRPQTRHVYAQRHARLADGMAAGPPVWVKVSSSSCRTSSATGNPASPCATSGDEVSTNYDFGPDNSPNNLLLRGTVVTADGISLRTCYTYDALGRRIGEVRPNANLASCPSSQSGALAFASNKRFDAAGRVTGTISADPDASGAGNPHLAVRNTYDSAGRLTRVESGTLASWQSEAVAPAAWTGFNVLSSVETAYDEMGRKARETRREGSSGPIRGVTQFAYDGVGRPTCTAIRMNPAAFGAPPADACAPGTEGSAGPDRISRNVYDAAGQRIQLRRGVGTAAEAAEATWAYDSAGRIIAVVDGNGNRATLSYDGHGRQTRWTFPAASGAGAANPAAYNDSTQALALATAGSANAGDYEEYRYDPAGNRISLRKRDGSVLVYDYDALNRPLRKLVPERAGLDPAHSRDVHYGYDLRGLQLYARFDSASGEGVASAWDGFGRLVSSSIDLDGVTRTLAYQHDRDGNRTRITHPDGAFFSTSYDGLDRPEWLTDPSGSALAGFAYAAGGTPSGAGRPGATSGLQFDSGGGLISLSYYLGPTASLDVNWIYARNPAGQIASISRDNDAYAWTGAYAVSRPYAVNGLNQYTAAGAAAFAYDANGNLSSDNGRAFGYDIENRLVSAAPNATLRYDPLGRLYQVAVGGAAPVTFLYDGDALVAEYSGATLLRRYVHGVGADVPLVQYEGAGTAASDRRNLLADHQGSIVATSNNAGTRLSINSYDEYGIPAATNGGRFQYTGQIWLSELGMYHYKARIYSPFLGRFLQVDPVGYDDQFNLYAYVGNDPVNNTDPDGKTCVETRTGYNCRVDRVVKNGQVLSRDQLTAGQRTALAQFERRYSRAVTRLMERERPTTVGATGGRPRTSFETTSREVGRSLISRQFVYLPNANQGRDMLGTGGHPGQRNVFTQIYGDLGLTTDERGIVHDGIHSTHSEFRGNVQAPNLGREPFKTEHQRPYNDAARELLGEGPP